MNNNNYKLFKETLLRMAGEVGLPKNAVANDLGLLKETNNMDNKKLKQLVKEALSNMVEEETETENEVEITVNINGEEQELDEIDVDDLADKDFGEAMSANEMYRPAYDIHDSGDDPTGLPTDSDDHFQNVEEMDMGGGTLDKDAKNLANFLLSLPSDIEDNNFGDELSLREFFDIKEMARVSDTYEGSDEFVRLLQLMNTNIQGPGGRGRKRAPFTSEDLKNIINIVDQGSFTALDISNAIMNTDSNLGQIRQVNKKDLYDLAVQKGFLPSNWDKDTIKDIKNNNPTKYQEIQDLRKDLPGTPQWVNAKLNHIEKGLLSKNYVTRTSELKKSMEPDTSAEPKRRGRPPAPKPPSPEDEFDAPEMEPEMAPDDDPVVQQATQAQAQAQDPKRKAVKDFMDQMKAMGIISDTNKVLDMDTYKDEFAKFKSTMSENNTLNESKKSKKELLTERFQQLSGIKPMYAINSLNENLDTFLNSNFDEVKGKIGNIPSKFKIMGDPKVATAGLGEKGIDVSFDKEHLLSLFPEEDPYNEVESIDIAGKTVYYNNYLADDEPWTDPAGGTHYGDEDDPAAAYIEEDNTLNESKKSKKQLLTERFQQLAGIKPLYAINSLKEGTIEQEWDGLSIDEKKNILDAALINPAEADYKDFDQLKAENDDFESGVANYLGIDEGEELTSLTPNEIGDEAEEKESASGAYESRSKNEIFGWGKKKGSSSGSGDEYVWYANSEDGKKRKIGSGSSESDAKSGWNINSYSKRYKVKNFTLEKDGEQIKSLNPTY